MGENLNGKHEAKGYLSEMWLKNIVKRIIYRERTSSKAYISYMRNKGAKIGDRVTIFSPRTTDIDMTGRS